MSRISVKGKDKIRKLFYRDMVKWLYRLKENFEVVTVSGDLMNRDILGI